MSDFGREGDTRPNSRDYRFLPKLTLPTLWSPPNDLSATLASSRRKDAGVGGKAVAVARHGETVYVSRFPPFDPATGGAIDAPIERQTEIALEQSKFCLKTARSSLEQQWSWTKADGRQ